MGAGQADHRSDLPDMATPVGMRHIGATGKLCMTLMRFLLVGQTLMPSMQIRRERIRLRN
jgi:hypothetical protein